MTNFGKLKNDKFSQNILFSKNTFFQKVMKISNQKNKPPFGSIVKNEKKTHCPIFIFSFQCVTINIKEGSLKICTSCLVEN